MTLLAAVRDGDGSFLVGADGLQENTDNASGFGTATSSVADKLYKVPDRELVWSYAGNVNAGAAVRDAMEFTWGSVYLWPETWADLYALTWKELRRHGSLTIGWNASTAVVLFVGFLEGEGRILEVNPADDRPIYGDQAHFVGVGGVAARVGWRVASEHPTPLPLLARFQGVLEATVETIGRLDYPLSVWHVGESDSEHVVNPGLRP